MTISRPVGRTGLLLAALLAALVAPASGTATASASGLAAVEVPWPSVAAAAAGGWTTSAPFGPDGVVLVGADWGGAEDVSVEVRTERDGEWSGWTPLELEDDHAPDPSSPEATATSTLSEPVWIGRVSALQVRTDAAPGDVELTGVRIDGDLSTASGGVAAAGTTGGNTKPRIVTRREWGADESWRDPRVPDYAPTVRFGVVHHTASSNNYSCSESASIVRSIYQYHVKGRGWWDIAYNFLIDKCGNVFEGRYGGVDRAVIGAHASGFNSAAVGVSMIGDYSNVAAPAAGAEALEQLLAWKFTHHHVDPLGKTREVSGSDSSRWSEGTEVEIPRIVGHTDLKSTTCPGSYEDMVRNGTLAKQVAERMGPQIFSDARLDRTEPLMGPPTKLEAHTRGTSDWTVQAIDRKGRVVRSTSIKGKSAITASWDHKDQAGDWVEAGDYTLRVSAVSGGTTVPPMDMTLKLLPPLLPEWAPFVGDWNGDGTPQPAWFHKGRWIIDDGKGGRITFTYGRDGDHPIVGDWTGRGRDLIGIIRDREWHLKGSLSGGSADHVFTYGRMTAGDIPLVGDWDGNGRDEIGIVRDGEWHLRNSLSGGSADRVLIYGRVTRGDIPLVGDWDGRGGDTVGIVRDGEWHLRNSLTGGSADLAFTYGRVTSGDFPIVGDWDDNGSTNVGIVRGDEWHLRDSHSGGPATTIWTYGKQ